MTDNIKDKFRQLSGESLAWDMDNYALCRNMATNVDEKDFSIIKSDSDSVIRIYEESNVPRVKSSSFKLVNFLFTI